MHLLDELNRSLPEHMWLTRFEDIGGDSYAIEGVTFSNFLVSDFLQNVAEQPVLRRRRPAGRREGRDRATCKVVKFKARARAVRKAATPDVFEG